MGSKPSFIKKQRGWIEKLVSWELGGRMVRKKEKRTFWEWDGQRDHWGRKQREWEDTARGTVKREGGDRTERREGLEGAAAPGRGGKAFQELRLRQRARRSAGRPASEAARFHGSDPRTRQLSSRLFVRIPTANHHRRQLPHFRVQVIHRMTQHVTLNPPTVPGDIALPHVLELVQADSVDRMKDY